MGRFGSSASAKATLIGGFFVASYQLLQYLKRLVYRLFGALVVALHN